jgi:hypothetical protein
MKRLLIVLGILLLALSAASADVTLNSPTAGQVVGPSTAVTGMCSQRAFVIVITEVTFENGESLGFVPGIRHWTNDDNSIAVRISTPRIYDQPNEKLTYTIHVKAYSSANQATGTPDLGEAVVTCYSR